MKKLQKNHEEEKTRLRVSDGEAMKTLSKHEEVEENL